MKREYYYGRGGGKTAVVRVRLFPNGEGSITVNGKNARLYFGQDSLTTVITAPLRLLELASAYNMTVRVVGGGVSGQAGAIRHGVARDRVRVNPEWTSSLLQAGFL